MKFNYQNICQNILLKDLPLRHREIIARRFGLKDKKETLESIGRIYDITRERVRQIEEDGFKKIEEKLNAPACQKVFQHFFDHFKKAGSLQREDLLLEQLGGSKFQNHIFLLLTLAKPFERFAETEDFYGFWTTNRNSFNAAKKAINSFVSELKKKKQPLSFPAGASSSYIEISKNILKGPEGLYGLKNWPEINPRGIKDRAYIALKKEKAPLHFTEVTRYLGKNTLSQTVHNELIKDPRFVLVGRGLYGLREWGYEPGLVREVIAGVIRGAGRPVDKDKIIKKVLEQRQVKPNTVLLNLQNKKYFVKNSEGEYTIRKA